MTGKWKFLITKDVRRLCVVNQQKWDRSGPERIVIMKRQI